MFEQNNSRSCSAAWTPFLHGQTAGRATTIAKTVAWRCASDVLLPQALRQYGPNGDGIAFRWQPASVGGGNAGLALLTSHLHHCFPNEGWDLMAQKHFTRAVAAYNIHQPNFSLFAGASGLYFAATVAAYPGGTYVNLRDSLQAYLASQLPQFLQSLQRNPKPFVHSYDLISGAAGVIACIVSQPSQNISEPLADACIQALRYLVQIAEPSSGGLCCFIDSDHIRQPDRRKRYPDGYTDTGLAHGVSAVIGAFAIALKRGWDAPGLCSGLQSICQWLAAQRVWDEYGSNWPVFIAPSSDSPKQRYGSRAAWCYGIPGTARALYMAADVLQDDSLRQVSLDAFSSLAARPRQYWGIISPNLCHGFSGVMQSLLRMFHDTNLPMFVPLLNHTTETVLSLYNPRHTFGFQDKHAQRDWYDNPRLLEGAAGVALALLAASEPVQPSWDRLLLLS